MKRGPNTSSGLAIQIDIAGNKDEFQFLRGVCKEWYPFLGIDNAK